MSRCTIDLNADAGESPGDIALLDYVSSVNLGGAHVADYRLWLRALERAADLGVAIGAHPSLPDIANFGRRVQPLRPRQAVALILDQVGGVHNECARRGLSLRHVKLHGALYGMAAADPVLAGEIVEAMRMIDPALLLFAPPLSALTAAAGRLGVACAAEAFADRGYAADGSLIPRTRPGALLDTAACVARVRAIICDAAVTSVTGWRVAMAADTICLHGDTPGALTNAMAIRAALAEDGITVCAP